jgi:hypothetical protein
MTQDHSPNPHGRSCPSCGEQLQRDGELLRCKQHGLFFRYGPRLLVHVARPTGEQSPLMPWQTLQERASR